MSLRGDTIVEVLLSTVVLSIVLAGAFNLSNRAIQTGQASLERTEAVNIVRDYAETLRFIHSTDVAGYDQTWDQIVSAKSSSAPSYSGSNYCDISVANPLYFDFSQIGADPLAIVKNFSAIPTSSGALQYANANDNQPADLFAVWLEVYDAPGGVIDIHVRSCWETITGTNVDRAGSVVRLSETRDI